MEEEFSALGLDEKTSAAAQALTMSDRIDFEVRAMMPIV